MCTSRKIRFYEAGAWVISQGKEFFLGVWREPQRFWRIMIDHDYLEGYNF